jgi:hypothetical protein
MPPPDLSKRMHECLQRIIKKDEYAFFLKPVPLDIFTSYLSVCPRPMDFEKIQQLLKSSLVQSFDELENLVALIFDNCMAFNDPASIWAKEAAKLKEFATAYIPDCKRRYEIDEDEFRKRQQQQQSQLSQSAKTNDDSPAKKHSSKKRKMPDVTSNTANISSSFSSTTPSTQIAPVRGASSQSALVTSASTIDAKNVSSSSAAAAAASAEAANLKVNRKIRPLPSDFKPELDVWHCNVCDDDYLLEGNVLVQCSGCNLVVHQMCYGVEEIPEGDWFCDTCSVAGVGCGSTIKCALCLMTGGALKPTDRGIAKMIKRAESSGEVIKKDESNSSVNDGSGGGGGVNGGEAGVARSTPVIDGAMDVVQNESISNSAQSSSSDLVLPLWAVRGMVPSEWAHVLCASYVPEVTFEDVNVMAPIVGLGRLHPKRCKLTCRLCHKAGGAPVQCSRGICGFSVHVTCARSGKLEMLLEEDKRSATSRYVVHCNKHADSSQDDPIRYTFPHRKAVERATFRIEVEGELTTLKAERERIASKVARRAERDSWLRASFSPPPISSAQGKLAATTTSASASDTVVVGAVVDGQVAPVQPLISLSDTSVTDSPDTMKVAEGQDGQAAIEGVSIDEVALSTSSPTRPTALNHVDNKITTAPRVVIGIASSPPLVLPDAVLYEAMSLQSDAAAVDNANYDSASEVETEGGALSAASSSTSAIGEGNNDAENAAESGGADTSVITSVQTAIVVAPTVLPSSSSSGKLTKAQRRMQAARSSSDAKNRSKNPPPPSSPSPSPPTLPTPQPLHFERGERPFSSMCSGLSSTATLWPAMGRYFSHVSPTSLQPFFSRYTEAVEMNPAAHVVAVDNSSMIDDEATFQSSSVSSSTRSTILEIALQPVNKQLMMSRERDSIDASGSAMDSMKAGTVVVFGSATAGGKVNALLSGYPPPLQPDAFKTSLIEAVSTELTRSEEIASECLPSRFSSSSSTSSSSAVVPPHSWVRILQSAATRNGNLNSSFLTDPNVEINPLLLSATRYKPYMRADGYFKGFVRAEDSESIGISTDLDLGPLEDIVSDNIYKHNGAFATRLVAAGRSYDAHANGEETDLQMSSSSSSLSFSASIAVGNSSDAAVSTKITLPIVCRRRDLHNGVSSSMELTAADQESVYSVPPLGQHFSTLWAEEDGDDALGGVADLDGSVTGPLRPDLLHTCASLSYASFGNGEQLTEQVRSVFSPQFTPNMLHIYNTYRSSLSPQTTFRFAKSSDARTLHVLYQSSRTSPPPFFSPGDFRSAVKAGKNDFILLALEGDHIIGFIVWKCRLFKSAAMGSSAVPFRFSRVMYIDGIHIVPKINASSLQESNPSQIEQNKALVESDLDLRLVQKTWYPPASVGFNPGGSGIIQSWLLTFSLLFGQYFGLHAALFDLQPEDEASLRTKLVSVFHFSPLESNTAPGTATPLHLSLAQGLDVKRMLDVTVNSGSSAALTSSATLGDDHWEDEVERELRDTAACLDLVVHESRHRISRLASVIDQECKKRSEHENQRFRRLERRVWRVYGNEELRRNEEKEDERKRAEDESDAVCSCCGGGDSFVKNLILFCERPGCNLAVHQQCYGIPSVPAGEWLCAPCSGGSALHPSMIACVLCGVHGGPLRPVVASGTNAAAVDVNRVKQWCHPHCARLISVNGIAPHVKVLETGLIVGLLDTIPASSGATIAADKQSHISIDADTKNDLIGNSSRGSSTWLSFLLSSRLSACCCVCGTSHGVCIPCCVPGCSGGVHPLCALECGLVSPLPPQSITPPLEELTAPRGVGAKRGEVLVASSSFTSALQHSSDSLHTPVELCCQPFFADTVLPLQPSRLAQLLLSTSHNDPRDEGGNSNNSKGLFVFCASHKLAFPGRLQEGAQEDNEAWDAAGVSGVLSSSTGSAPKRSKSDKSKATAIATSLAFGGSGLEVRPLKDLLSASQLALGTPSLPPRRHSPALGDILTLIIGERDNPSNATGGDHNGSSTLAGGSSSHSHYASATVATSSLKKFDSYALRSGVAPLLLPSSAPSSSGPVFVPLVRALVSLYGFFVNVGALNTSRRLCSAIQPSSCRRKFARLHEVAISTESDEAKADLKKAIRTIYGKNCYLQADVRDVFGVTDSSHLAADDDDNNDDDDDEGRGGRRNVKMRESLRESERRDEQRLKELDERIATLEEKAASGPDGIASSTVVQLSSLGPEGVNALSPRSKNRPSMVFARSFLGILEPPAAQYSEFCSCHEMRDEPMVGCDTENCPFFGGWMHLKCAGLEAVPEGSHFCSGCKEAKSKQENGEREAITSRVE